MSEQSSKGLIDNDSLLVLDETMILPMSKIEGGDPPPSPAPPQSTFPPSPRLPLRTTPITLPGLVPRSLLVLPAADRRNALFYNDPKQYHFFSTVTGVASPSPPPLSSVRQLPLYQDGAIPLRLPLLLLYSRTKPTRTEKIKNFPVPNKDVTEVRRFQGMVQITRRWIRNFAEL